MMTVLWYYRPEDADGASIVEFTQVSFDSFYC